MIRLVETRTFRRHLFGVGALAMLLLVLAPAAMADDAGVDASMDSDAAGAGADNADAGGASATTAIACDGALCDTTNSSACSATPKLGTGAGVAGAAPLLFALALLVARRRLRLPLTSRGPAVTRIGCATMVMLATTLAGGRSAMAAAPPPVDVKVQDPPSPTRTIVVSVEPLPIVTIGKWSANVVFAPVTHHALSLSPFYASTRTVPVAIFDNTSLQTGQPSAQLPKQHFEGFGAELGYRYYFGNDGPRGVFVSPSLLIGSFTATAADTAQTGFWNLGLAADAGYEALIANRFAITLGAGLQGTVTTRSIPNQQFPAELYANGGLRPRLLLSFGWAF